MEGTGFEPSVPLLRKALLGVANRRRPHERRSHLQVQVRNGNACLEWLPTAFPFAEGRRVRIRLPPEEALDLIEQAVRRNLVLLVDHTFLYTPAVRKIRQLIGDGVLGDIYYYNGVRASLGLFQNDVNVIWDLAVHDISIIQYIFDEDPVAASATAASHVPGSPENMAHITLFFRSSCIAQISVNWLSPVKVRQTFIGGSRKMIVYDDMEPTEKIKVYDKGITVNGSPENTQQLRIGYRAGDMWAPHLPAKEALQTETEHFVECLCQGTAPISSGLTGLRVIEILKATCRSIAARGAPDSLICRIRARRSFG